MGRVVWKENKVISFETMDGIYVLAQMLKSPYLLIYNQFSKNDEWGDVALTNDAILFCKAVTKQFLKSSVIATHKEVCPLYEPCLPKRWIKRNPESYMAKIWGGTDNEVEFVMIGEGGGALIEMNIYDSGLNMGEIINPEILPNDNYDIDNYELTDQALYPSFNERVYLCFKLGKNVSPDKDLIFNRPVSLDYKRYFQIISGKYSN
jgi:hypothetical protein